MKNPLVKSFAGIVLFVAAVSLACNLSSAAAPTSAPSPTGAPAATSAAATSAPAATTAPASGGGGGGGGGGACANAYYPVANGNSWSYASNSTTSAGVAVSAYTYTTTVTALDKKLFTTQVVASTGSNSTINWNCQAGNLAVLDAGGATTTTAKVTVAYDSISAVGYNIPASFNSGADWTETITATAKVQATTTRTVDSQIVVQLKCSDGGADKTAVPAGNFDTVKADCTKTVAVSAIVQGKPVPASTIQEAVTYWYAKKVGLVKSVADINAAGDTSGTAPEAIQTVMLVQYQVH